MTSTACSWSKDEIGSAIRSAMISLGLRELKTLQKEVIKQYVRGKNVFVSLSTGYGKSLCCGCLPIVYDSLRRTKHQC